MGRIKKKRRPKMAAQKNNTALKIDRSPIAGMREFPCCKRITVTTAKFTLPETEQHDQYLFTRPMY